MPIGSKTYTPPLPPSKKKWSPHLKYVLIKGLKFSETEPTKWLSILYIGKMYEAVGGDRFPKGEMAFALEPL